MSKKPRFFCDNCGHEVERDAKTCSHCGRFFASVRCPSCGYTGEEKAFSGGCPSCGYSAPPRSSFKDSAAVPKPARPPEQYLPARPLPLWVYILSICAFIAVCAVLVSKLLR